MRGRKKRFVEDSRLLAEDIAGYLSDKKAVDIITMDFSEVDNIIFDYFVICSGTSRTHVQALSDNVIREVRKNYSNYPWVREGEAEGEWILLDYGNVIVHVFQPEQRRFYNLESLWADADIKKFEEKTEKKVLGKSIG